MRLGYNIENDGYGILENDLWFIKMAYIVEIRCWRRARVCKS